jgi:hypothetical protein
LSSQSTLLPCGSVESETTDYISATFLEGRGHNKENSEEKYLTGHTRDATVGQAQSTSDLEPQLNHQPRNWQKKQKVRAEHLLSPFQL